jgi:hypothetical protein
MFNVEACLHIKSYFAYLYSILAVIAYYVIIKVRYSRGESKREEIFEYTILKRKSHRHGQWPLL